MIDPSMFPSPESPYATNGIRYDAYASLSLLSFHLDIVKASGNLHHDKRKAGYYFFRDSNVPKPRPSTVLMWNRLCRLGRLGSRSFMVPFLPSLRAEDELGQAIAERGIHVPSLGRQNSLHIKERVAGERGFYDAILWGDVFVGEIPRSIDECKHTLNARIERSNIVEALITPRHYIDGATAQDSIRARLEFLAQYGLVGSNEFASQTHIPRIHRLLFQILDVGAAFAWADAYCEATLKVAADPGLVQADYQEQLESYRRQVEESQSDEAEKAVEKHSTKRPNRMDFSSLDL